MTKNPKRKLVARVKTWSFRHAGQPVETSIYGYGRTRHRLNKYGDRDPWLSCTIRRGNELDVNLSMDLVEAKRMHAELGEAIAKAESTAECNDDCTLCRSDPQGGRR